MKYFNSFPVLNRFQPSVFRKLRLLLWLPVLMTGSLAAQQCAEDEIMDLDFWFKADAETYTDGASVPTVTDQSPNGFDLMQPLAGRQPSYTASSINFNPAVTFDGGARTFLTGPATLGNTGSGPREVFAVTTNLRRQGAVLFLGPSADPDTGPTTGDVKNNINYGYQAGNNTVLWATAGNPAATLRRTTPVSLASPVIGNFRNTGTNLGSHNHTGNGIATSGNVTQIRLSQTIEPVVNEISMGVAWDGNDNLSRDDLYLGGDIAEVLYFGRDLTAAERERVLSYLGLKYGITYAQTYTSLDGGTIFYTDGAGYDNNIAGLVRDDCSGLFQKQSNSTDDGGVLSIAAGSFAATNAANTATFADGDALVFGNTGDESTNAWNLSNISLPGESCRNVRVDREWNFQETAGSTIGTVALRLDVDNPQYDIPVLPPGATTYSIYLDDDGDFTNGGTTAFPMTESGGVYVVDLTAADRDGKAFWTFGAQFPETYTATFASGNTTAGREDVLGMNSFVIQLPFPNNEDTGVMLDFAAGGTATEGTDYTITPASPITVPAGQTSVIVEVMVIDDNEVEPTETIELSLPSLTLSGGEVCNPADPAMVTITILDNDVTFTATGTAPQCTGGDDGSLSVMATAPLPPAPPFSVSYTGPESGSLTGLNTNPFIIENLMSGVYTLMVTDGDGRTAMLMGTVGAAAGGQGCDGDGDGVPDAVEVAEGTDPNNGADFDDADMDGVPDYVELTDPDESGDADNDELVDSQETCGLNPYTDFDEDGIPLYLDPDDLDAAVNTPALQAGFDLDMDGLADFKDPEIDQDTDGVPDYLEVIEGTNPVDSTSFLDADGDGTADYTEVLQWPMSDADGDGVNDTLETGGEINFPYDDDIDLDGKPAYLDSNDSLATVGIDQTMRVQPPFDADGNGIADFMDPLNDLDGDGVPNCIEFAEGSDATDITDFRDSDMNGTADFLQVLRYTEATRCTQDSDGDGATDSQETGGLDPYEDLDNDCVPAYLDAFPAEGASPADKTALVVVPAFDVDRDGIPDYLDDDLDADDDGVPDYIEAAEGTQVTNGALFLDSDDDGISDYAEVTTDFANSDADGDGVMDIMEITSMTSPYLDEDCDGVPAYLDRDDTNVRQGANNGRPNRDFDVDLNGIAEFQDPNNDTDGDGVPNRVEVAEGSDPKDGDPTTGCRDSDGDGICDFVENTNPADPNIPADTDGDGFPDTQESCGLNPYADADMDGVPAYLDDNDGTALVGNTDNAVERSFDVDQDGLADFMDPDADADDDGVPDFIEGAEFTDPNDADDFEDADVDGISDYAETLTGYPTSDADSDDLTDGDESPSNPYADTDLDGKPAYLDDDETNPLIGDDDANPQAAFDVDGNGIADFQDGNSDSDGDGVPDCVEAAEGTSPTDAADFVDSDGDETPDFVENAAGFATSDEDNDGILTFMETGGLDPYGDCDGDCIPAYLDDDDENNMVGDDDGLPESFYDVDGDGTADFQASNTVILIVANARCTDDDFQPAAMDEYYVEVTSITGGNGGPYTVSIGAMSRTGAPIPGDPIVFGPFTHSGTGTATQTVVVAEAGEMAQLEVVETLCGYETENGLNVAGGFCDGTNVSVFAQSEPGTFRAGGNTKLVQTYVLADDAGNIVATNNTGLFSGLVQGTYDVYALNYEEGARDSIAIVTMPGAPVSTVVSGAEEVPMGRLSDACYSLCGAETITVMCDAMISISDPCICFDVEYDAVDDAFEFIDSVLVISGVGESWRVLAQTGLEVRDTFENRPLPLDTMLIEVRPGNYTLSYAHTANVGYSITVTNVPVGSPAGTPGDTLTIGGICFQPQPIVAALDVPGFCIADVDVPLEGMAFLNNEPIEGGSFTYQIVDADGMVLMDNVTTLNGSDYNPGDTVRVRVRFDATGTDADDGFDNDFCDQTILYELPVDAAFCDCDLEIEDIEPICVYFPEQRRSRFALDLNVTSSFLQAGEEVVLIVDGVRVDSLVLAGNADMTASTLFFDSVLIMNGPGLAIPVEIELRDNPECRFVRNINLTACSGSCVEEPGRIGGVVFYDEDLNGARDGEEAGVGDIRVRVYDCNDNLLCQDFTTNNGDWFCRNAVPGESYRVEFDAPTNPEFTSTVLGEDNESNVQFITVPTDAPMGVCGINYGVTDPSLYCQDDPLLVVPCYYVGGQDRARPVTIGVYYDTPGGENPRKFGLLNANQIGTTWGVAYQKDFRKLYSAAVVRNYMDYGPAGFDAIYVSDFADPNGDNGADPTLATPAVLNLEADFGVNLGTDPRTVDISGEDGTSPFFDDAYTGVGRAGIGDIDISNNGDTLFVVNLNEARPSLILLDISDPDNVSLIADVAIPDPGCSDGDFAPWAVKHTRGSAFVGVTCTAETSEDAADLSATVYRFNGTTFETIASTPLNYPRGAATYRSNDSFASADWQPWTNDWDPEQLPLPSNPRSLPRRDLVSQPMPILQDIEFGDDGSLYMSLGDRFSFMAAFMQREYGRTDGEVYTPVAGGDLLRFCLQPNGDFEVEGTNGCPQPVTDRSSIEVPAIPTITEYFDDNYVNEFNSQAGHAESVLGGLVNVPGRSELITVSFDPLSDRGPVNTSGIRYYSETGMENKGIVIVPADAPANNAKGGSLGDLEALCDEAPIEIGNYAWFDLDSDGAQDPCEPPIANLMMKLFRKNDDGPAVQLATTTTNDIGQYSFIGDGQDNATWTGAGAGARVTSVEQYFVVACGDTFNAADSTLTVNGTSYCLTAPNLGARENADLSDSDFTVQTINGTAFPAVCTEEGQIDGTNSSFDIGLKPPPCELDFNDLTVDCTNDNEFLVTFTLFYDYDNASADGEQLNILVNGENLQDIQLADGTMLGDSPVTLPRDTGTLTFLSYSSDVPQFGVDVRTFFTINRDCEISRVIDLVACTEGCDGETTEVGGNVFLDNSNDGVNDATEFGQPNVSVKVYSCEDGDAPVCETFTNENGDWSCDGLVEGREYRVEYSTPLLPGLEESFAGPDNGTSVQFVLGGTCEADYALLDPATYCNQRNLVLAVACYETGRLENGDNTGNPAFISFSADASGDGVEPSNDATLGQVGSVWGTAHVPKTSTVYTAAVLKRHTALVDGLGFLYQLDYTDINNPTLVQGLNLEGVVPQNRTARALDFGFVCRGQNQCDTLAGNTGVPSDYLLPADPDQPSVDLDAFAKIGKVGYGDIDYDPVTGLLWMVNLNERTLLSMDVSAADPLTTINAYEINDAFGIPACPGGEPRPWALHFRNGLGYLGLVCDASSTQSLSELEGFVMQFDPAAPENGYTTLVRVPLQEPNSRFDFVGFDSYVEADLVPWVNTYEELPEAYRDLVATEPNIQAIRMGQPILSDIDFDPEGNMTVSIMDRTAMQLGFLQYTPQSGSTTQINVIPYGDLFHFCPRGDGGYRKENTGDCQPTAQNPYYNQNDDFYDLSTGDAQNDGPLGSHLYLNDGQIAYTIFDPYPPNVTADPSDPTYRNTQGIHYNSTTTGERLDWYQIVDQTGTPQSIGKGIGLGDLIALCDAPAIQLGNYAWIDENEDGIQDPCEPPLAGITVKLYSKPDTGNPTLLATTMTNATGNYYFSSASADDPNLLWEGTGPDTAVVEGNRYFIAFCGDNGYDTARDSLSVDGVRYCLTTPNAVTPGDANPDNIDSDLTEIAISAFVTLPAYCTVAGETDTTSHTFDAGFKPIPMYDLALRKTLADGQAGSFRPGDAVLFDIEVVNQSDTTVYDVVVGDSIPAGLLYDAAGSTPSGTLTTARGTTVDFTNAYALATDGPFTIDSLLANDSVVFQVAVTIDAIANSQGARPLINYAEIQAFDDDMDPNNEPPMDEDSTPDANFGNDPGGAPGSAADDQTGGDGTGMVGDSIAVTDEDDADPARIPIFDLALTKVLDTLPDGSVLNPAEVVAGDLIPFTINVFNQGTDSVTNVVVRDSIPCGYSFNPADNTGNTYDFTTTNPDGAASANSVYALVTEDLAPGSGIQLTLQLTFEGLTACGTMTDMALVNRAEIQRFTDTNDDTQLDFDSTPDNIFGNDGGGLVDSPTDNILTGNGTGMFGGTDPVTDEDDEDPSSLNVFDLAIFKRVDTVATPGPYVFGDRVKFDIGVISQGNLAATEVEISDIVPEGLSFDATDQENIDEGWTTSADGAMLTLTPMPPLGSFDTAIVSIYLTVLPATGDAAYTNFAEIVSGSYDDPNNPGTNVRVTGDGDSPYSLGVGNDTGNGPNSDDDDETQDNRPGEDIDSQDPAFIEVLQSVAVGDTTFIDVNMNGIQDLGDLPLANVTVTIFDVATGDPVALDAFGMPYVSTQTTDMNGAYLFGDLPAGNYFVRFDITTADNFDLYDFTTPNAGDNDALDSDVVPAMATDDVGNSDPTGAIPAGDTVRTLDAGVVCAVMAEVAEPFTICATQDIDLSAGASITPARLGGNFTTDGSGVFLDADGNEITDGPFALGTAVTYRPSSADAVRGFVTLTLTSNNPMDLVPPSVCAPVSASVRVEVLKVDCGQFFWDGRN